MYVLLFIYVCMYVNMYVCMYLLVCWLFLSIFLLSNFTPYFVCISFFVIVEEQKTMRNVIVFEN